MESSNNLIRLLFITLCLVVSINARLTPDSPSPSPADDPLAYIGSAISEAPSDSSVSPSSNPYNDEIPPYQPDLENDNLFIPLDSVQSNNVLSLDSADFSSSLHSVGPNPKVTKICDNTDHPPLCLATILPLLKGGKVDVESVLKVAVEAGADYAKEALSVTKNLITKADASPELLSTYKDCKDSYDVAVENFAKTVDAFATKDIGTMRSVLSAVITFVGDCEDEFAEMQTQSPLSGYAEKLTDMTSNCLAIVEQMMN